MRETPFEPLVGVGKGQGQVAKDLNRALGAVQRVSEFRGTRSFVGGDGHHVVEPPEPSFWAKITEREDLISGSASATGSDSGTGTSFEPPSGSFPDDCPHSFHIRYGFQEVSPLRCGGDIDREDGITGNVSTFPAYEMNDQLVEVGTRVRMWVGPDGTFCTFVAGGSVAPVSGSCSGSNVQVGRTIQFQASELQPDGTCCTKVYTVAFPFDVEVCVEDGPCVSGSGTDTHDYPTDCGTCSGSDSGSAQNSGST